MTMNDNAIGTIDHSIYVTERIHVHSHFIMTLSPFHGITWYHGITLSLFHGIKSMFHYINTCKYVL